MCTVYASAFIDSASGVNLDKLVEPFGITRKASTRSTGYARFEGVTGANIPALTVIKTVDDSPIEFTTDSPMTIADIVTNGGFDTDTSGWTAENNATIASVSKKINFTSGGTHEVVVGDTLTGNTSGATGVVSAIVLDSGSWAGGDAAGTFYFSAQSGTFGAETLKDTDTYLDVCDVSGDSDDVGGVDGNALVVIGGDTDNPLAKQIINVTPGLFYEMSVRVKAGTAATYNVDIHNDTNDTYIYQSGDLVDTSGDWSTVVSRIIEIPLGCTSISIRLIHRSNAFDKTSFFFDSCEMVRIVPITSVLPGTIGNVAANTIISLNSPISGITSVTNPVMTDGGADKESDTMLRIRTKQSLGAAGRATLNAIVAAVLAIDNVSAVTIEENDTAIDYSNRLLNPNFVEDISHWYASNGTISYDAVGGIDNGGCIVVTGDGVHDDPYAHQLISVEPGEVYTLSTYIKAGTVTGYKVSVHNVDDSYAIIGTEHTGVDSAGDWSTSCTIDSFVIPDGCYTIEVRIGQDESASSGTMSFDATSLHLDPAGLPPHSIRVMVEGGDNDTIAQALLDTVAGGIRTYGDEFGTAELESNGQIFTRHFARPTRILITVNATIASDDTYIGDEAVETAIIDYIGGTDSDGAIHGGLNVGEDVIFYEVVAVIMSVTGVTNVSSITVNGGTSDISIANNEVAYATTASVTIS